MVGPVTECLAHLGAVSIRSFPPQPLSFPFLAEPSEIRKCLLGFISALLRTVATSGAECLRFLFLFEDFGRLLGVDLVL